MPAVLAGQVRAQRSSVNSHATANSNAENPSLAPGLPPLCERVKRVQQMCSRAPKRPKCVTLGRRRRSRWCGRFWGRWWLRRQFHTGRQHTDYTELPSA